MHHCLLPHATPTVFRNSCYSSYKEKPARLVTWLPWYTQPGCPLELPESSTNGRTLNCPHCQPGDKPGFFLPESLGIWRFLCLLRALACSSLFSCSSYLQLLDQAPGLRGNSGMMWLPAPSPVLSSPAPSLSFPSSCPLATLPWVPSWPEPAARLFRLGRAG